MALAAGLSAALWAEGASAAVYTSNLNGGNVFQYGVGASGLLSPLTPAIVPAESAAVSVAISPDGTSVYVVNRGTSKVGQYTAGPPGTLSPKSPASVEAGTAPEGIAISPDGASVYVANTGSSNVSQYDVGAGGTLTPKSVPAVASGGHPDGVAVSPDGKSVYVICAGAKSVYEYDVGPGGALTPKASGPVPTGEEPSSIAISPDGTSVYVADYENEHEVSPGVFESGHVAEYSVGAGGALTPKSPAFIPAGEGASGVAVSPDGASVYVANDTAPASQGLSQYNVGPGGVLSPKSPAFVTGSLGPLGIIVSPDGRSVYMTDTGPGPEPGTVSQYDVGAGGLLAPKSPASVEGGLYPTGIAMTPDQGPTAAFTATAGTAGTASSFNAAASGDPDGTVASFAWRFGDGSSAVTMTPAASHVYAAPGNYAVSLQVTDNAGCSASFLFTGQTAYCNAGARAIAGAVVSVPAGSAQLPRPEVGHFKQSASRWRLAGKGRRRTPVGTTFSFVLNASATVKLAFARLVGGRKVGHACVAPNRRNRHRSACRRALPAGAIAATGHAGANKVVFKGLVASTRKLKPGTYKVTLVATNAAGRSRALSLTFTILAPGARG